MDWNHAVDVDGDTPLLWVLRDVLGNDRHGTLRHLTVHWTGLRPAHEDFYPAGEKLSFVELLSDHEILATVPSGEHEGPRAAWSPAER